MWWRARRRDRRRTDMHVSRRRTRATVEIGAGRTERAVVRTAPRPTDTEDVLRQVQGLGPRRIARLAEQFPTPINLRLATRSELLEVPGVGEALADRILSEIGC